MDKETELAAITLIRTNGLHGLLVLSTLALLAACSASAQPEVAASSPPAHLRPEFPDQLRGVWDVAPQKCAAAPGAGSDTRIEINAQVLHGYESTDQLKSIEKISSSPDAWRVVTIADIAPAEIQGEADIYTLEGQKLAITNGTSKVAYFRCK